jgi:hypothetical protein
LTFLLSALERSFRLSRSKFRNSSVVGSGSMRASHHERTNERGQWSRALRLALPLVLLPILAVAAGDGWYLLRPPISWEATGPFVNSSAPLSQWEHESSHDSAKECEAALAKSPQRWTVTDHTGKTRTVDGVVVRCISVGDPRLRPTK